MNALVQGRDATRTHLARLYAPIADELALVEARLKTELRSEHPFIDQLARHSFRLAGKRLRPALLLLSAKAVGEVNEQHIRLAAAVEMIHTATLVHDDVLDEATVRRHRDTVNARWNNETSVLLGDYLFSHAFYLASTTGSTFACETIGRATNRTCEGELRQTHAAGDFNLTEDEYLAIVEAKTAELCACACRLGAHFADASDAAESALAAYGRHLGIAFQITDDLLDLQGDELSVGKSLGTDLEKRKPTLPIIHLLRHLPTSERVEVVSILTRHGNHRLADLRPWFDQTESLDYAASLASDHARSAAERLAALAESPIRDLLAALARFVVRREA